MPAPGLPVVLAAVIGCVAVCYRGAGLATAMAAFGILWGLGNFLGPGAGGIAMAAWDPHGFPGAIAVACAGFIALTVLRGYRRCDQSVERRIGMSRWQARVDSGK